MSASILLYAWANPVTGTLWDHTWVTTYDNRSAHYPDIGKVVKDGLDYWFCWGDYHPSGSTPNHPDGFLGAMSGDLGIARCLCRSNAPSKTGAPTCGTIFTYGIDGVCHQLANQVLWATKGPVAGPLTVSNARGYHISSFFFGTYGNQSVAWKAKQQSCAPLTPKLMNADDEFEIHARQALSAGKGADKLQALLDLRAEALAATGQFSRRSRAKDPPTAEELNATYNAFLERARKLLGADFKAVFGPEAKAKADIVDPAMMRASGKRGPRKAK